MVDEALQEDVRKIREMLVNVVVDVAVIKEKLNRVDSMEEDVENLREEITNMKISRVKTFGAVAGASGLGASISEFLKYLN